jgi:uncharacterized protein YozE (UPF0346 family)
MEPRMPPETDQQYIDRLQVEARETAERGARASKALSHLAGASGRKEASIEIDTSDRIAFGRWLLTQRERGDWVDTLADAARSDARFPKDGDPEAVRTHLRAQQADGDVFAAMDDAEADWLDARQVDAD